MAPRIIRDNWEAVTARGAAIRQFDDSLSAARFAKANEHTFPGITVIRVTITQTEERKVEYRPRPKPLDLDVPAMPVARAS